MWSNQNIWGRDKIVFNSAVPRNTLHYSFTKYSANNDTLTITLLFIPLSLTSLSWVSVFMIWAKDCFNQFFLCGVKCYATVCCLKRITLISLLMQEPQRYICMHVCLNQFHGLLFYKSICRSCSVFSCM